jgi:hypothetical protein
MENQANTAETAWAASGVSAFLDMREDWRLAHEAHRELQTMGMPLTNVLLVGAGDVIRMVLGMLRLEQREPVLSWRPGQRLKLPALGHAKTLVLHDVSELTCDEQLSVLRWLDWTAGRIPVVSTTAVPLLPLVKSGAFNDVLYYRLNTVYVDVASRIN